MSDLNYFRIHRLSIRLYDQMAEPVAKRHGLSYMEFVILMALANNRDIRKASDIVERLGIAKSHVSLSLSSLEEKGLIGRKEDEKDKRASVLFVSDSAMEIIRDGRRAQKKYKETLVQGFSEYEKNEMEELMKKVETNVRRNLL